MNYPLNVVGYHVQPVADGCHNCANCHHGTYNDPWATKYYACNLSLEKEEERDPSLQPYAIDVVDAFGKCNSWAQGKEGWRPWIGLRLEKDKNETTP